MADVVILAINMGVNVLKKRRFNITILFLRDETEPFEEAGDFNPPIQVLFQNLIPVIHFVLLSYFGAVVLVATFATYL